MLFKKENYQIKSNSIGFYQDLEHIDGVALSSVSANLYTNEKKRDELVLFYFRKGANHATVYTQSNIKSENIKWNLNNSKEKIYALLVNTRNANAFTGKEGYKSIFAGFLVLSGFVVLSNLALGFTSIADSSIIAQAMQDLFGVIPRLAIASFIAYIIAQSFDIFIYHKIKERTGQSKLWLRNNISTIISQLVDSVIFFVLAFGGTVSTEVMISLILSGWLFKIPIAFLDTIFIYLSYTVKGLPTPDFKKLKTTQVESPAAGIN